MLALQMKENLGLSSSPDEAPCDVVREIDGGQAQSMGACAGWRCGALNGRPVKSGTDLITGLEALKQWGGTGTA